ncbi:MAG: beta-lactamase family protein [Bacteroidales bacterium]|nr:beta-lactamase family protein [Bacteroidales bacterium]MBN2763587.1 beta-lactamase family protein [Bacteroidales bacterium]
MSFFRPVKIFLIIAFAIVFFLGDITSTFSYKRESEKNIHSYGPRSFAHKLNNSVSDYQGTAAIDSIFSEFLIRHDIKGASVAVTKKGKLVYARGLGYANYLDSTETAPWNLFRIASVSKLITATAILKLAESGKLNLEDKVFGNTGWLNDPLFLNYTDKRIEDITVYHLLTHTSGWNHKRYDPVFGPLVVAGRYRKKQAVDITDLIRFTLERKLDFNPGSKYSYSNTGYCILGEIIERASGMPYEDYVQFTLLHPLGIYNMRIGKSFPEEMPAEEVMYYVNGKLCLYPSYDGSGLRVPLQYGGNDIELLGPAGGWIASAPELAKLIVALDGFSSHPDILSKHSVRLMTRHNKSINQLLGWRGNDGRGTWWRTGTLTGTAALIMRFNNDTNWVILLNTTSSKKSRVHNEMSKAIYRCMGQVKDWPSFDLFSI